MEFSILSHLLSTERYHKRASLNGGFAVPLMLEVETPLSSFPILVTGTRGNLVLAARSREGTSRFAFAEVPLDEEGLFFLYLVKTISELARSHQWGIHCSTIGQALSSMRSSLFQPKSLIISEDLKEEVQESTKNESLQVIVSSLEKKTAILVTDPTLFGVYTRVGDYLGLQLFNIDKTLRIVDVD